jgi:integration host factor subunit alpha
MATKKLHIIENLQVRLGLSKAECVDVVDKFFKIVKETLSDGKDVKLSGFGTLMVKHKRARKGRNPHTGEEMELAERKVATFKLSEVLKDEINRRRG